MSSVETAKPPSSGAAAPSGSPDSQKSAAAPQTPLDIWRSFDLNGRRSSLDKQGLDIADRQEASSAARKQLATATRSFKKSLSDGAHVTNKEVGALLKLYQTEIDTLTNRAKAAEASFLSLYKALDDAPDPVEELAKSSRRGTLIGDLREELKMLRDERGGLVERSAAAAQYEKRIEELETQLNEMNVRVEEAAREQIEEKQAQWMSAQQKTIEAYEMREQELLHQIRLSDENARRLQAKVDDMQRQVNDARSQIEAVKTSRANVNEMAAEDLERTRAEAKSLRRRCIELENQLVLQSGEGTGLDGGGGNAVGRSALCAELAARDVEVSQLKDQVSALEEVLGGKDEEKRNEFARLSDSIAAKDAELLSLKQTLEKLPTVEDYETMARQFETLQAFQLLETEKEAADAANAEEDGGGATSPRAGETLEKRLLGKVKSLEGKLTRMRVDLGERDSRITELLTMVRSFEEQVGDQKELIAKLEEGINAMTGEQSGVHALRRRAAAASRSESNLTQDRSSTVDDDKDAESTWDWGEKHQAEGLQNIIREEPSMLDIVAGQRDRFRARTMELEDDNRKLMERIEKLTSDLDSLKSDNVRLYEKIRFLQSYKQSNGSLGNSAANTSMESIQVSNEIEDGVGSFLGKYRSMYEDMVNPYTIFNRRERHKRISEMSAPERLTLRASQKALSTKTSRLFFFFYIISLHVFVGLVLGFSSSICENDVTTKAQH